MALSRLILVLLFVIAFCLSVILDPISPAAKGAENGGAMERLLGDSRRLFANQFFVKADAYFHSGYYPTIFDRQETEHHHLEEEAGAVAESHEHEHQHADEASGFLNEPHDWIERFGRHFFPSTHTHLDEGGVAQRGGTNQVGGTEVKEILPWLRMSADLDPHRIETYTVAAYWLRNRMGKVKEAERFLLDGLQANPRNPAVLYELGRIYYENHKDAARARNVWELALKSWPQLGANQPESDKFLLLQIALHLAQLEENEGNLDRSRAAWELAKTVSPHPEDVQKRIDELQERQRKTNATPGK